MNGMKTQNNRTLKDELPGLVGAQYAMGDQWRNNSRKNEETWLVGGHNQFLNVVGLRDCYLLAGDCLQFLGTCPFQRGSSEHGCLRHQ